MLGQVIVESQNSGAEVFSAIFVIASLGWFIFVIWWMVSMKNEIQRIRQTIEHRVYDFDHDEDEGPS
jgi:hypothetical protein